MVVTPPAVGDPVDDWFDDVAPPDPSLVSQGAGANAITAASWGDLPSYTCDNTLTNPHATRSLLVAVQFGAWVVSTSADVRASVASTGGDVSFTATPGGGGVTSWGQVLMGSSAASAMQSSMFTIEIPAASSLSIKMQAYRASGTTCGINYPWTQIVPLRYV